MWKRIAAGALVLGAGACSLIAGLDGLDFDAGAPCDMTTKCESKGPCVQTTCDDTGACVPVPLADGTPTPGVVQVAGDCHQRQCVVGVDVDVVDDTDTPASKSACVDAVCTGGTLSNAPTAAGTACQTKGGVGPNPGTGTGVCDGVGACVGCTASSDCTSPATCGGGNPGVPGACGCTRTTCAALGLTCGATSDACGGMLACDDGVQDGTETDVDCGGGCATKCVAGKKCAAGADCATTFCVDGVCCNSACPGVCRACSITKKGVGADGVCGAVAAMTDPDSECAPYTCGSSACLASCGSSDAACAAADYCDGADAGACVTKKPALAACVANHECQSAHCIVNICM